MHDRPRILQAAERMVDGGWENRNVHIVVAAPVINENSGAARVVAAHAW